MIARWRHINGRLRIATADAIRVRLSLSVRWLVDGVRGEWTFTPDGSGAVIRWTYEFKPLRERYWLVRDMLTPLWRHYMQAGVEAAARAAEDL